MLLVEPPAGPLAGVEQRLRVGVRPFEHGDPVLVRDLVVEAQAVQTFELVTLGIVAVALERLGVRVQSQTSGTIVRRTRAPSRSRGSRTGRSVPSRSNTRSGRLRRSRLRPPAASARSRAGARAPRGSPRAPPTRPRRPAPRSSAPHRPSRDGRGVPGRPGRLGRPPPVAGASCTMPGARKAASAASRSVFAPGSPTRRRSRARTRRDEARSQASRCSRWVAIAARASASTSRDLPISPSPLESSTWPSPVRASCHARASIGARARALRG